MCSTPIWTVKGHVVECRHCGSCQAWKERLAAIETDGLVISAHCISPCSCAFFTLTGKDLGLVALMPSILYLFMVLCWKGYYFSYYPVTKVVFSSYPHGNSPSDPVNWDPLCYFPFPLGGIRDTYWDPVEKETGLPASSAGMGTRKIVACLKEKNHRFAFNRPFLVCLFPHLLFGCYLLFLGQGSIPHQWQIQNILKSMGVFGSSPQYFALIRVVLKINHPNQIV